jgi:nucleoside-diphosphate kinase
MILDEREGKQMRGFILLKPESIQRNLVGKILCFIEDKGLKIVGLKMLTPTIKQIQELYCEHKESPHFEDLIRLSSNHPVIAIALESPIGVDSSELMKDLQGKHDVSGTIRFYYSSHPTRGVLHCSTPGSGLRESSIFFSESEINHYNKVLDDWIASNHNEHSPTMKENVKSNETKFNQGLEGRKVDLLLDPFHI